VVAVEPAESAVLSGAATGAHRIEGIGIGFIPPLWRPELVDSIEQVRSDEAQEMARRLANRGRNLRRYVDRGQRHRGPASRRDAARRAQVVTLAVDSGLRYLSTAPYA
jgi:cysteine synthase A